MSGVTFPKCGGLLGWEQIGGMLIVRDGSYSARCSVCGWSYTFDRPKKGATCDKRRKAKR